jgi:hypothetical protein
MPAGIADWGAYGLSPTIHPQGERLQSKSRRNLKFLVFSSNPEFAKYRVVAA